MFGDLQGLGMGIVVFAIIIGVGTVTLYQFGGSVACSEPYETFNASANLCVNNTATGQGGTTAPAGTAYTNINYMNTNLGTSGLSGWVPAIIAISVGLLFLGAFMMRGSKTAKY